LHHFIVHFSADRPGINQQLGDGVEADVSNPGNCAHGHALAQQIEDLGTGFEGKLSHTHFYMSLYA
jgi:hypothetical protein